MAMVMSRSELQRILKSGDEEWQAFAACKGLTDWFFVERGGQGASRAKRICAGCPVQEQCLDFAVRNNETMGIWGGKSERERRAIRRQLHRRGQLRGI